MKIKEKRNTHEQIGEKKSERRKVDGRKELI